MTQEQKHYAERDIEALDEAGGYYFRHVSAMTGESLHGKSKIAAELAFRDAEIDRLTTELKAAHARYAGGGEAVTDVDELAQFIRKIDGNNTMGAGALAEAICGWLDSHKEK